MKKSKRLKCECARRTSMYIFCLLLASLKKAALFLYSCSWLATIYVYIYIYCVYIVYIYIYIHSLAKTGRSTNCAAATLRKANGDGLKHMSKHMFNPIFAW